MESRSQARGRWRLLGGLGQACGLVAGTAALGLVWAYALTTHTLRRPKGGRAE